MTSVLIDASQLSGQSAFSGIGTYIRGLLNGIREVTDVTVEALATSDAELPDGMARVPIRRLFRQGRLSVYEHETMRTVELRTRRAKVFHNPNPHAPRYPTSPWVQTLHDVIPLVLDDPYLIPTRRRFERYGPRYAAADKVIAVSRFAADQGIEHLGLRPGRIEVIHHGVGPEFTPGPESTTGEGTDGRPPYLTLVSEYSGRKGFPAAFEIVARLADEGLPHRLKVVGRIPPWATREFDQDFRRARRPDRIDVIGFVPDLVPIYQDAAGHLMVSRHEGFGLPALEAMACGTPVIAFDNTALREVVGPGGIVVPDGDVVAAAEAFITLVRSPTRRSELSAAALQWIRDFTWERSSRLHAEVYRSVSRG